MLGLGLHVGSGAELGGRIRVRFSVSIRVNVPASMRGGVRVRIRIRVRVNVAVRVRVRCFAADGRHEGMLRTAVLRAEEIEEQCLA